MSRVVKYGVYCAFVLSLFECSCRLLLAWPFAADALFFDEDLSWRRLWIRAHQHSTRLEYAFDIYDPTKGWLPKPNLRDVSVFGNKILNTNSRGIRGKTEYSYGKHENNVRILLLGDSFTFGDEVSDNDTYAHYLQEMIPGAEIINMGVHGYGHDQMLILLEEEGVKYKPDIVLLGFVPIDMSRNLLQFRSYAKPKFVVTSGNLQLTGSPVPLPEDVLKWDWTRPRLYDISAIFAYKFKKSMGFKKEAEESVTTHIFNKIIEVTTSIHATPIFVYLPTITDITDAAPLPYGETFLFSFCKTNSQARCFSARPYFTVAAAQATIVTPGGHWEPSGHLAAAKAIMCYLINDGKIILSESMKNIGCPPSSTGVSDLSSTSPLLGPRGL